MRNSEAKRQAGSSEVPGDAKPKVMKVGEAVAYFAAEGVPLSKATIHRRCEEGKIRSYRTLPEGRTSVAGWVTKGDRMLYRDSVEAYAAAMKAEQAPPEEPAD